MPTRRALHVLLVLLALAGMLAGAGTASAVDGDDPKAHVSYGPPEDKPKKWEGLPVGIDRKRHYCIIGEAAGCHMELGTVPGTMDICEGLDGIGSQDCSKAGRLAYEKRALERWRKANKKKPENWDKLNKWVTRCVVDQGKPFKYCQHEGNNKYPPPTKGPSDWAAEKVGELASDALSKAAQHVGKGVVWQLGQFADSFTEVSTVHLRQTGIGRMLGLMVGLSGLIATFLLLFQFGKLALSQQGAPLATGIFGLLKYGAILSCYLTLTQTALYWSDRVSVAIISLSLKSDGSTADATAALTQRLGTLFAALVGAGGGAAAGGALLTGGGVAASAVAVVILVGFACIIAICTLWLEMLMRQAAIMLLVVTMPIALSGQLSDATSSWWPRSRDALIAVILTKPVICLCFAIGFTSMGSAEGGMRNVLVGLLIFLMAGVAWPVCAVYFTFTTNGDGKSLASGALGQIGSSIASAWGQQRGQASGAGAVGGGSAYTQALEGDSSAPPASGGGFWSASSLSARMSGSAAGGSFGSRVGTSVGLGLQLANAGKEAVEGGMANQAAHAGLGPAHPYGGHVVAPRRGAASASTAPQPEGEPDVGQAHSPRPPVQQESVLPPTPPRSPRSGEDL